MTRWLLLFTVSGLLAAADFRAGVARLSITPEGPIWMSGYANRKQPSEAVAQPLWAKALALEDPKGGRIVIVTTDIIGLPRVLSDVVAARVQKQYGLRREQLLLNSSHTHAGPVVRPNLTTMYDLDAENDRLVKEYSQKLGEQLVTVIGAALGDLRPATLSYGSGATGFAFNRREPASGGVKLGNNPKGPVDHSVPVVRVTGEDGGVRAILFGYACHNTTLGGNYYKIHGDYAGSAQIEVEKAFPSATALFVLLCGGDQNPNPRGAEEMAAQHGKTLAVEVGRVLSDSLRPIRPPIRAAFHITELPFAHHTRETFEQEAKDSNPFKARRARAMLEAYDQRRPVRRTPYPVQAVRFGNELTLLALGGEVVVDYALRAKREFSRENLVVAGYSNDVMCYIPSLRVLKEGGYEADSSMIYYGMPGPFAEDVEETVFAAIRQVMKRVGAER